MKLINFYNYVKIYSSGKSQDFNCILYYFTFYDRHIVVWNFDMLCVKKA